MKWIVALVVVTVVAGGVATFLLVTGDGSEEPTVEEVEQRLRESPPFGNRPPEVVKCEPAPDEQGYFDCVFWFTGKAKNEADSWMYDLRVNGREP